MKSYIKTLFFAVAALLSTNVFAADKDASSKDKDKSVIALNEANTVSLAWVVNNKSVAVLSQALLEKSQRLREEEPIYLVLDTPGGSIVAGNAFLQAAKAIKNEIKTISLFAASMGFHIQQSLGERLVTEDSIIMSHRAAGEFYGQFPGNLNTELNMWMKISEEMDETASKRMGLSTDNYRKLIADEYWVHGKNAVKDKAADRIVKVTCDKSLDGVVYETIQTFFGDVTITRSKCPAIRGFLDVRFDGSFGESLQGQQLREMYKLITNDPSRFVKDFIVTNRFQQLQ